ncbi:Monocarboxylate transporter 14 [Frankliniella fusca]|uniref:Monocarboxylate transporter 14 n=1 Tax=Frankliniella fusca TaxID=407009 RepID=A0AAE1HKI7_9NEOP|nr:Monocarboxylate transporter 14 [Frankliniella fusca]
MLRCNTWPQHQPGAAPDGLTNGFANGHLNGRGLPNGQHNGHASHLRNGLRDGVHAGATSSEDSGTEEVILAPLDAALIRRQVSQIQRLHEQNGDLYRERRHARQPRRHRPPAAPGAAGLPRTIRTQIPLQTTAAAVLPVLVLAGDSAVERAADLVSGASARRPCSPVLALDSRKKTTLSRHYYPEGGWGWVVVTCSVVVHLLGAGLQFAWPVMQRAAADKFAVHLSHTDLTGSHNTYRHDTYAIMNWKC